MSGSTVSYDNLEALDNDDLQSKFTISLDFKNTLLVEGTPEAKEAIDQLNNSKFDQSASVLRYIKKGKLKSVSSWDGKLKKFKELKKKHAELEKFLDVNGSAHDHFSYGRHAKTETIFSLRLEEIKKAKSKSKSCKYCKHTYDVNAITPQTVKTCRACRCENPFPTATYTKRLKSEFSKLFKLESDIKALRQKLLKDSPYLYAFDYHYRDESEYSDGPDIYA